MAERSKTILNRGPNGLSQAITVETHAAVELFEKTCGIITKFALFQSKFQIYKKYPVITKSSKSMKSVVAGHPAICIYLTFDLIRLQLGNRKNITVSEHNAEPIH